MRCCFCGTKMESIDQAIDGGWYPEFWRGSISYQGPICPECQQEHLFMDDSGEYILKPDRPLPPAAEPQGVVKLKKNGGTFMIKPKFSLGQIVATPEALRAVEESGQTPGFFLDRHLQGDWGDLNDEDKRANDQALVDGSRLLSAYRTLRGVRRIWIITEAVGDDGKRAATTILLPEQY